ncbi:hypothetical protein [Caballeronia sordidicola]|uniref:hypothetical protein n=1 Tax=Caballeronia sordidicola TaxID=196367 RepID=UPI0004CFEE8B|nr:hypothetical protein [Caballeronia sordidicola]
MTWSRLLGIMVLVLLVNAASVVGIVLSFALVMRYLGSLTVWNEIFPWATDTLDMITSAIAAMQPLPVLLKRLDRVG